MNAIVPQDHRVTDEASFSSEYRSIDRRFSIDLLDILQAILDRKRSIIKWTFSSMLATAAVTLLIKNSYSSTAVILPPRQDQSASMLLSGQMGALSALSGSGSLASMGLNLKNPNEIYVSLIQSRTVGTNLVDRFHLKEVFKEKYTEDALKKLASLTTVKVGKDNLIRITVTTHDKAFSSQLANAYVDQLHALNTSLALTDSAQRRLYFQGQLEQEKTLLATAESSFVEMQKKTGILLPSGQAEMAARSIATVRGQLIVQEAELESMRTFASENNPEYIRVSSQIAALRKQLSQLENNNKMLSPGDIEVPTSQLSSRVLEYTRKFRDVKMHEAIYEALLKQFEAAKLDEAKTAPMIQVVDPPIPADRKSGPFRSLIVLASGVLVFFITAVYYGVSYGLRQVVRDQETESKIRRVRTSLRW